MLKLLVMLALLLLLLLWLLQRSQVWWWRRLLGQSNIGANGRTGGLIGLLCPIASMSSIARSVRLW